MHDVLRDYSEALGIAYQIRDDLDDLDGGRRTTTACGAPSLPLGARAATRRRRCGRELRHERSGAAAARAPTIAQRSRRCSRELGVEDAAAALLEAYKEQAIRSLPALQNASLKGLLRRVIGKIFTRRDQGMVQ